MFVELYIRTPELARKKDYKELVKLFSRLLSRQENVSNGVAIAIICYVLRDYDIPYGFLSKNLMTYPVPRSAGPVFDTNRLILNSRLSSQYSDSVLQNISRGKIRIPDTLTSSTTIRTICRTQISDPRNIKILCTLVIRHSIRCELYQDTLISMLGNTHPTVLTIIFPSIPNVSDSQFRKLTDSQKLWFRGSTKPGDNTSDKLSLLCRELRIELSKTSDKIPVEKANYYFGELDKYTYEASYLVYQFSIYRLKAFIHHSTIES